MKCFYSGSSITASLISILRSVWSGQVHYMPDDLHMNRMFKNITHFRASDILTKLNESIYSMYVCMYVCG